MRDQLNDVGMTAKLYEARRCARFIAGDNYTQTVEPYKALIARVAREEGKRPLSAMIALMQATDEPIAQMFLLAAAVEVIESESVPA